LATFWLTKSLVCIDAFIRNSTIQSDVKRFYIAYELEDFGSLSAVWMTCHTVQTPIYPLFHPSGRRAIPSGCSTDQASFVRTTCHTVWTPDKPSIICPDDVHSRPDLHCFEKLLFQLASVWTLQQPVRTPLSDRSASDSFQVQFKGRLLQPSGRRGFLSGRTHI
jgi:hypothetical protein